MKSSYPLFLSWIKSCHWYVSKYVSPYPRSSRFSLIFSSKSFIVFRFILGLWSNHSELIFVKCLSFVSTFIFLLLDVQFSSTFCWKDCLCPMVQPLLLCQRSINYIYVGLFLSCLFCPIGLFVSSFSNTTLSWLLWLYNQSWSWVVSVFQLCSSPILCLLLWVFYLSMLTLESVC